MHSSLPPQTIKHTAVSAGRQTDKTGDGYQRWQVMIMNNRLSILLKKDIESNIVVNVIWYAFTVLEKNRLSYARSAGNDDADNSD